MYTTMQFAYIHFWDFVESTKNNWRKQQNVQACRPSTLLPSRLFFGAFKEWWESPLSRWVTNTTYKPPIIPQNCANFIINFFITENNFEYSNKGLKIYFELDFCKLPILLHFLTTLSSGSNSTINFILLCFENTRDLLLVIFNVKTVLGFWEHVMPEVQCCWQQQHCSAASL